ncbi:MAG: MFS transporter [Pseudomonadales bacterium]|nr:MFS transporter [Pseudomonadales bacterium]
MVKKLQRNIKLVYGLAFFHCFMLIVPVIVPFFMSKGLGLAEIFYLQTIYAATIVLLEAPSGYFADLFGRRSALLAGSVMHGFGYLLLNFADDFFSLMVFEISVGIAGSLLSGADLALLYDSQKALDEEDSSPHSTGIAHLGFIKSCAEGIGALLGGLLALWSFEIMVVGQSAAAWVCFILALFVVEPPYKNDERDQTSTRLTSIFRHMWRSDQVLRNVFIAIPIYNLATIHVVWLVQPYWESRGISLAAFGLLWFAQSLTVGIASRWSFNIERKHGAIAALCLIGVLPVLGFFGMAWLQGWAGIAVGLLLFFGRGLVQVILVNALNRRVPGSFRATANSLTSFTFRLGFITTGPLVGFVAESQGLPVALNLLGVAFIVAFVFIMMPLIRSVRILQQQTA